MLRMRVRQPLSFDLLYLNKFLIAWLFLLFFAGTRSSEAADIEIGRHIENTEHKVIHLTVPFEDRGKQVAVMLVRVNQENFFTIKKTFIAREGRHAYEIRDIPEAKGYIPLVMLSLDEGMNITGEVVSPSFWDELDIFFAPQVVISYTVHGLEKHTLFGISWNSWILAIFVLASVFLYIVLSKPLSRVLFLAFWIAWGLVDLRAIGDHFGIIQTTRTNKYWISELFSSTQMHLQKYSAEMEDKTWTLDKSWEEEFPTCRPLVNYALAEKRFIPYENKENADYLLSIKDGEFKRIHLKP